MEPEPPSNTGPGERSGVAALSHFHFVEAAVDPRLIGVAVDLSPFLDSTDVGSTPPQESALVFPHPHPTPPFQPNDGPSSHHHPPKASRHDPPDYYITVVNDDCG